MGRNHVAIHDVRAIKIKHVKSLALCFLNWSYVELAKRVVDIAIISMPPLSNDQVYDPRILSTNLLARLLVKSHPAIHGNTVVRIIGLPHYAIELEVTYEKYLSNS